MISYKAGFSALHMADHVPFYPTLPGERLKFHNTLFRIILTKDLHARFDGSLGHLHRLGLRNNHKPDFIRVAVALAGSVCNVVQCSKVVLANGVNEIIHGIITIFGPLACSALCSRFAQGTLLQRDQCPETTCTTFFGAMREPIRRMASRTDPRNFDLTHTHSCEQQAIGLP